MADRASIFTIYNIFLDFLFWELFYQQGRSLRDELIFQLNLAKKTFQNMIISISRQSQSVGSSMIQKMNWCVVVVVWCGVVWCGVVWLVSMMSGLGSCSAWAHNENVTTSASINTSQYNNKTRQQETSRGYRLFPSLHNMLLSLSFLPVQPNKARLV